MKDIECIEEPDGSLVILIHNERWAEMIRVGAKDSDLTQSEYLSKILITFLLENEPSDFEELNED